MMEGILSQRITPLLKCVVLFLFIFTAKVLTTRPHESQDTRNSIHHPKSSHYVRTFTKYHHRRTIHWNNLDASYWPLIQDQPRIIAKRSVENPIINELLSTSDDLNRLTPISLKGNVISDINKEYTASKEQHSLNNIVTKYQVKAAAVITEAPTTTGPTRSCLYKIHSVAISVTPSYDEGNAQSTVENEIFDTGTLSESTLPSGEVVQVEQCTDPKAFCYTLWHQDNDSNITVLGQGCWRSSQGGRGCDKCTRVTPRLPGTRFCCCTRSHCNADFTSLKEETVTIKAESTMESRGGSGWGGGVAGAALAVAGGLLLGLAFRRAYCRREGKGDLSEGIDVEKGEVMGAGPDALATGLLCVDNITLIEHIGQGKFGSVWRGSLGGRPVAVKLYASAAAWRKEAAVYALPHLAHPNILTYYGSDSRPSPAEAGGRSRLVVLELCVESLRSRLVRAPLDWQEFATLARGLAAALAHLHTPASSKPCVVHRDVNSGNVLVSADGQARLADLGLAQALPPRPDGRCRLTEAGTLRYLAPEALEGALDLSGARAALCAVDVFALGLVLWEMLWRCGGARARVPPYAPPYHAHGLPARPSLAQMQALVSRGKARPPLPAGRGRALRLAAATCDECWDHDAEARLTAVCVEERMAELRRLLAEPHESSEPVENEKNWNCTSTQNDDVASPLPYSDTRLGRNPCIERNTHTDSLTDTHNYTLTHTVQLIYGSLGDGTANEESREKEENRLTRGTPGAHNGENSDRLNEIRSYRRPLEYIQNDVTAHEDKGLKETNLLREHKDKSKWGIRKFFNKKSKPKETEVKLESTVIQNGKIRTSLVERPGDVTFDRPGNLVLNDERRLTFEPCTLSPPNKTLSPTMIMESELNTDKMFKELPSRDDSERNQIFAVIVPKAKPDAKPRGSSESLKPFGTSVSSQSIKGNSESEDSIKKRLSCDNKMTSTSGGSSRASVDLELRYIEARNDDFMDSPFDLNSDCSSSEDEHLMLLAENGGSKITMQTVPRTSEDRRRGEVLKESRTRTDCVFNKYNRYSNFDNEFSDPNDKENLNGYSVDNPVYLAAINGEIATDLGAPDGSRSPKPSLKSLRIKRQHSLEQVRDIFSSGDTALLNPAGRVKTPGDLPAAVRRARARDRGAGGTAGGEGGPGAEGGARGGQRANRLSLYDDRMMFGNTL